MIYCYKYVSFLLKIGISTENFNISFLHEISFLNNLMGAVLIQG